MQTNEKNTPAQTEVNLTPGMAALVLSLGLLVMGFSAGVSLEPFGIAPVVCWIFSAIQLFRTKKVAAGYASVFGVVLLMSVALFAQNMGIGVVKEVKEVPVVVK